MMPDHSKPFQIESDASKYASGAVLTQTDINGDRQPVAFLSKTFTDTEWWYKIYDRELLGIVQALKEWQHYIQGSGHTTLIHMDHRNLTYFRKAQKLSDWQARWSLFLSEFDIKLQHLPGNKMILSDALSRRPDHCPEEDETKEEILLPDNLFLNLLDINLRDRITKNKDYDFNVTRAIELLQEEGPTSIQNDLEDWKIEEVDDQKTIFYKGKQYVLKDQELWWDILKLFHDHETVGHPGKLETYNSVKQHYWWPGLRIFVKNYVKGCGICQQFKIDQNPSHPFFHTSRRGHIDLTIRSLQYELNHRLTSCGRKQLNLSRGRPRPFEGGNSLPNHQNSHNRRNRQSFAWKPIQIVWITRQDDIWLRTTVCGESIQGNVV
jgi:RNase H-like domain found in reverse transcriptase/Integrase zinc binding domain